MRLVRIGAGAFVSGGHMKWQEHGEFASIPHDTANLDAAVMIFHNTASPGEAKTGAVALGTVERPEDVRQVLRGDAPTGAALANSWWWRNPQLPRLRLFQGN